MSVVTICTAGEREAPARVRDLLDRLARTRALEPDVLADMQVALDEVLSNIVHNGLADGLPHRIEVALSIEPGEVTAEVEDDCAPFDPLSVAAPDLHAPLRERRVGGLGVHFVRSLMSDVRYVRVGSRNRLVLRKRRLLEGGASGIA